MPRFNTFFSTDSAKAIKADQYGYLNGINYMAPHTTGGIGNLCPHSTQGCRDLCLGMYSGQAAMVKDLENGTNSVRESRKAKSQWFMTDRKAFMAEMAKHVSALIRKAERENKKLAIRPNGSTDIPFERVKTDNGQTRHSGKARHWRFGLMAQRISISRVLRETFQRPNLLTTPKT